MSEPRPFPTFVVENKNPERMIVALSQVIELLVFGKKSVAEGGIHIDLGQDGEIRISSDLRLSNVEFPSTAVGEEGNQYALRNPIDLDRAGAYYVRHVCAMTREGLHLKSKIAAELAYRDMEIDRLKGELAALNTALPEIAEALGDETLTSVSQVATGIRDLRGLLATEEGRLNYLIDEQAVVETIEPGKTVYLAYSDGRIQQGSFLSPREAIDEASYQVEQGGAA